MTILSIFAALTQSTVQSTSVSEKSNAPLINSRHVIGSRK